MSKTIELIYHSEYVEMILYKNGESYSVLYDIIDHVWIKNYIWTVNAEKYIRTKHDNKLVLMHRMILGLTDSSIECDHINRNPMDNRRNNLRISTSQNNKRNRSTWGQVQYVGVSICRTKYRTKYLAAIKPDRHIKQIKLGRFDSSIEAAKHYDSAAHYFFGEHANLNFPNDDIIPFESWFKFDKLIKLRISDDDILKSMCRLLIDNNGFYINDIIDDLKLSTGIDLKGANHRIKKIIEKNNMQLIRKRICSSRYSRKYWYFNNQIN